MKAITTQYHGPAESSTGRTRGPRYSATDGDGNRATVPDDFTDQRDEDGHDRAFRALAVKMKWDGRWFRGGLMKASRSAGYVYVYDEHDDPSREWSNLLHVELPEHQEPTQ